MVTLAAPETTASIALPGPDPASDPASTVPWLAAWNCSATAIRARLAGLESLLVGGVAGATTMAKVAVGRLLGLELLGVLMLQIALLAEPAEHRLALR